MIRIAIAAAAAALGAAIFVPAGAEAASSECRVYDGATPFVAGQLQTIPCDADSGGLIVTPSGPNGQIAVSCDSSVAISTNTSGNVQLVALAAGQTIYVCGWSVIAAGTVAVQLITGTGTACATGETDLTGAYPLVANGGLVDRGDTASMRTAAGAALCVELSGAVQIDGVLYYSQF